MTRNMLIAGGGIGGLAAALACSRAACRVRLLERTDAFGEVGAGIQLGPNVTRLLHGWDLSGALAEVAAFPSHLQVRDAASGREVGVLRLAASALQRYGAPYATLHRADLHALLLDEVRQQTTAELTLDCALAGFSQTPDLVSVQLAAGPMLEADVLVGADGLWSSVRQGLLGDGPPRVTGHFAYRALVPQAALPESLRSQHVTVWLGRDLHVVQYPVRGGEWLNVVGIVQEGVAASPAAKGLARNDSAGDPANWDQHTSAERLRAALKQACAPLQNLVNAIEPWRRWTLCDRPPLRGADQMASGRVALLGDAAHPMLPYLAQGAGMAIEDAAALGQVMADAAQPVNAALLAYAQQRWQRNARVQARALRNGRIFHARGLVRVGRDAALKILGERLLDIPWLYRA